MSTSTAGSPQGVNPKLVNLAAILVILVAIAVLGFLALQALGGDKPTKPRQLSEDEQLSVDNKKAPLKDISADAYIGLVLGSSNVAEVLDRYDATNVRARVIKSPTSTDKECVVRLTFDGLDVDRPAEITLDVIVMQGANGALTIGQSAKLSDKYGSTDEHMY